MTRRTHMAERGGVADRCGTRAVGPVRAAVLLLVLLFPAVSAPAAPDVEVAVDGAVARLVFTWPDSVQVVREVGEDEVFLRFDAEIGDLDAEAMRPLQPRWVTGFRFGYDSLLLETAAGYRLAVSHDGPRVVIAFEPAERVPRAVEEEEGALPAALERRLRTIEAAALVASREDEAAERLLGELLASDPDDPEPRLLRAEVDGRRYRWHRAIAGYDRVLGRADGHPDVARARDRLWRRYGSGMRCGYARREIDDAESRHVRTWEFRSLTADELTVTGRLERQDVEMERFRPPGGGRPRDLDERLGVAALGADWNGFRGVGIGARLYAARSGFGCGGRVRLDSPRSESELAVDWNEPSLGYVESAAANGVRDRIAISHRRWLGERWTLHAAAARRNYGLDGLRNAAFSASLRSGLAFAAFRGNPYVALEYVAEIERAGWSAVRYDARRRTYRPLPLLDRTAHTLGGSLHAAVSDALETHASLGYSYDPEHGRGVYGEAGAEFRPTRRLTLTARTSQGLDMRRGDRARYRETTVGLRVGF